MVSKTYILSHLCPSNPEDSICPLLNPLPPADSKSFLGWDFTEQGFLTQDTQTMDRIQGGVEIQMEKNDLSFSLTSTWNLTLPSIINMTKSTVELEPVTVTHGNGREFHTLVLQISKYCYSSLLRSINFNKIHYHLSLMHI